MFDASAPLTSLHRDVLSTVCEISFAHNSLLYVALNKVDLVEPKSQLFDYSDAISEVIWKKKIEMLRKVVFSSSANLDAEPYAGSAAVGERRALHDFCASEGRNRRCSGLAVQESEAWRVEIC